MINLVISLLVGFGVWGIFAAIFSWYAAILPGLIGFAATYLVLAQRAMKELTALSEEAQKEMGQQRIDRAIETLKSGFPLGKRQFLVAPLLHANLGTLLYVKGDFDGAFPHLEKGYARNYMAKAMLGAYWFKKGDAEKMKAAFELATKYGKKDPLVWALYAYCLMRLNRKDDALGVLGRGVEKNPSDEKLKNAQLAVQNNKRMKMRAFGPQFYQFHLEPLPHDLTGGRRPTWQRR